MHTAIAVTFEIHAVFIDKRMARTLFRDDRFVALHGDNFFETAAKGQDLETSAIGKRGAVPVHEFRETTGFFDKVWTWLEIQVVGI